MLDTQNGAAKDKQPSPIPATTRGSSNPILGGSPTPRLLYVVQVRELASLLIQGAIHVVR